tara:strand:- start:14035 stop:15756 length:1722 start_codon:yes stop_codon:yes gene_type:complete
MKNALTLLFQIYKLANSKWRIRFFICLVIGFTCSIIEIFVLSLIGPLIGSLLNNNFSEINKTLGLDGAVLMGFPELETRTLLFSVFFILVSVNTLMRVWLTYLNAKFAFDFGAQISAEIFARILESDYKDVQHIERSKISGTLISKSQLLSNNFLKQFLNLITGCLIIVAVLTWVLVSNNTTIIGFIIFMTITYGALTTALKPRAKKVSASISHSTDAAFKRVTDAISSILELKVYGLVKKTTLSFERELLNLRKSEAFLQIAALAPKHLFEGIGIGFLLVFFFMADPEKSQSFFQTVSLMAYLGVRMYPIMHQSYNAYVTIIGNVNPVLDFFELESLFTKPEPKEPGSKPYGKLKLQNQIFIRLKEQSVDGQNTKIFSKQDLVIKKGSKVLISGPSGSGKSTLLRVIAGLDLSKGILVKVDGTTLNRNNNLAWQSQIAFVPQKPYLLNETLLNNVLFSGEKNDNVNNMQLKHVRQVLDICLVDFIRDDDLHMMLGEDGSQISGGQAQRVSISRALYRRPSLLILDESTSALDARIEEQLIENIFDQYPDLTVVMVSHNPMLVRMCDDEIRLR